MNPLRLIYADYRRYRVTGETRVGAILSQGLWASSVYRVTRWVHHAVPFRPVRLLFTVPLTLLNKLVEVATGIYLPAGCEVGEGLYIGHFGTIILPLYGRIGKNCNVSQGVTIGLAGQGGRPSAPTIGDRVYVGPHAVVVGPITVGDDVVICAGAVVVRSVPPRAVVLGNPARVVSYDGSFEYVQYDGMASDPDRVPPPAVDTPVPPEAAGVSGS